MYRYSQRILQGSAYLLRIVHSFRNEVLDIAIARFFGQWVAVMVDV